MRQNKNCAIFYLNDDKRNWNEVLFFFFFYSTTMRRWLVKRILKHYSWTWQNLPLLQMHRKNKRWRNPWWPPRFHPCIISMGENVAICSHVFKCVSLSMVTRPNNCEKICHFCVLTKTLSLFSSHICPSCLNTHISRKVCINTAT